MTQRDKSFRIVNSKINYRKKDLSHEPISTSYHRAKRKDTSIIQCWKKANKDSRGSWV